MTTLKTRAPRSRTPLAKPVVVRMTETDLARIDRLAEADQRSRISFTRLLILRGLAEYEKDFKFDAQPHAEAVAG